jgi:hypothetical protein
MSIIGIWLYNIIIMDELYTLRNFYSGMPSPLAYHIQLVVLTLSKVLHSTISLVVHGAAIIIILTPWGHHII